MDEAKKIFEFAKKIESVFKVEVPVNTEPEKAACLPHATHGK